MEKPKIAIVGGGVAGSTAGLYLSQLGLDITLFEQGESLVSGPPFCHLHAGGNLYREISDEQCITLLQQSIDLLRYYPYAIDYRPTVIAIPTDDGGKPEDLYNRLHKLRNEYQLLIDKDPLNRVLGDSSDYFRLYSKDDIERLKQKEIIKNPKSLDDWLIPVAHDVDLEKIQFPLIMVQEYGLNLFRLGGGVTYLLNQRDNARVLFNTKVTDIKPKNNRESCILEYEQDGEKKRSKFDYLINATGFRTGTIDDILGFKRDRLVEFKSAYVTKWENSDILYPEIVFYGERGTPRGMAQFTPYPNGYFQIHGMTPSITLFDKGLVKNSTNSSQPLLEPKFIKKIEHKWEENEVEERTKASISHISQYIPKFKTAKVASKPLFGAQQIPGVDPTLRASDVSFEGDRYARCEIVKASSVLSMIDAIVEKLIKLKYLDSSVYGLRDYSFLEDLDEDIINLLSKSICEIRDYPIDMADINRSSIRQEP